MADERGIEKVKMMMARGGEIMQDHVISRQEQRLSDPPSTTLDDQLSTTFIIDNMIIKTQLMAEPELVFWT